MTELTELEEELLPPEVPWSGVLAYVDRPSDTAPSGARHRVILTRAAAEDALPDLLGLPIFHAPRWDGHLYSVKCGRITRAALVGSALCVCGVLGADAWPADAPPNNVLGMSYNMETVHIADMRAAVWTITSCHFTGATVLLRSLAAYKTTTFDVGPGLVLKIEAQARPGRLY